MTESIPAVPDQSVGHVPLDLRCWICTGCVTYWWTYPREDDPETSFCPNCGQRLGRWVTDYD